MRIKQQCNRKYYVIGEGRYLTLSELLYQFRRGAVESIVNHKGQDIAQKALLDCLYYGRHFTPEVCAKVLHNISITEAESVITYSGTKGVLERWKKSLLASYGQTSHRPS
jgi:hypothetical protein